MPPPDLVIAPEDPRAADVRNLIGVHLAFARGVTPEEFSFALDPDSLAEPGVTFFSAREGGVLLGIAALKRLADGQAELKSMLTAAAARGRGVGRAVLDYVLVFARGQGYKQVSLETGTTEDFAAARALYLDAGFEPCGPFGGYAESPHNTFMTITLDRYCAGRAH